MLVYNFETSNGETDLIAFGLLILFKVSITGSLF